MTFAELQEAISKALGAGDVLAPEALLRTLEDQADANRSLMDIDQTRVIFEALHEEFHFSGDAFRINFRFRRRKRSMAQECCVGSSSSFGDGQQRMIRI